MGRGLLMLCLLVFAAPAAADDDAGAPLDSLIWISEEAAIDSLNRYWRELEDDWYEPLSLDDLHLGLTASGLDSLRAAGDEVLAEMLAGRPLRVRVDPFSGFHFNRVEGPTPEAVVTIDRPGLRQPQWRSRVGYGFGWERVHHEHSLVLPLATARSRDAWGRLRRVPWTALQLEASGGRKARNFGGDWRPERDLAAIFSGEDPSNYYEARWWEAKLRAYPVPWMSLSTSFGSGRDRPEEVRTRWSLFGDEQEVWDNRPALALDYDRWSVGGDVRVGDVRGGGVRLGAELSWTSATSDDVAMPLDDATFRRLDAHLLASRRDPLSNEWVLRGQWNSNDRQAPLQWKTWLGGWGTLRGFPAAELIGDKGGWASLDARWNVDLFKVLHVPLLNKLGLQPVTFVEYGRVWNQDGPVDPACEPGWRADAGFGLSRLMGFDDGGPQSLRFYLARPIGKHMSDRSWQFLVAMEWW